MKATLFTPQGEKKGTIELPNAFKTEIREDIVVKVYESEKLVQPYASFVDAGKRQSASGTISHKRHDWKGHYGRGISRIPRKTMSRRGTQFVWVGANIPGTRGGRKAHPPKGIGKEKTINKKEIKIALNSGFASTANKDYLLKRYSSLEKPSDPSVIESLPKKTKDLLNALKKIFDNHPTVLKTKSIRSGKGKTRGRKYKSNAGILIVTSSKENIKFKGFDIKKVKEITISDLYPLGRLTLYTQSSLEEIK